MNKFMRMVAMLLALVTVLAFVACTPTGEDSTAGTSESSTPSSSSTQSTNSTKATQAVTFRVKVVDEDGNPVEGVYVQICKESCLLKVSNAEGWAEFTNPYEEGYHANINGLDPEVCPVTVPEGKILDITEYDFEAGEKEMTLTLKFIDTPAEAG